MICPNGRNCSIVEKTVYICREYKEACFPCEIETCDYTVEYDCDCLVAECGPIPESHHGLLAVIGGVLGTIMLLALALSIVFYVRRRRRNSEQSESEPAAAAESQDGEDFDDDTLPLVVESPEPPQVEPPGIGPGYREFLIETLRRHVANLPGVRARSSAQVFAAFVNDPEEEEEEEQQQQQQEQQHQRQQQEQQQQQQKAKCEKEQRQQDRRQRQEEERRQQGQQQQLQQTGMSLINQAAVRRLESPESSEHEEEPKFKSAPNSFFSI